MSQKWLEKFGGYANEVEGTNYKIPDFKVSSKCCYYLKEKPCDDWAKENKSVPFLGLMASEGGAATEKFNDKWLQLLREINHTFRTVCNFQQARPFKIGA